MTKKQLVELGIKRIFEDSSPKYELSQGFIEGLRLCRHGPELLGYLHTYVGDLETKGNPREKVQEMLNRITEYSIRKFGKNVDTDTQGKSHVIRHSCFSELLPLFHGFVICPENHNTLQDLENSIDKFDFVAELHGL